MAYLLGWKDILRPIRDGYRHLFPTPDSGPTPEERRQQRALDRLKGFAYFDTFEQLESWTEADSDPLQRANTPLLRATGGVPTDDCKTGALLIHDYSGNYHDYESVQAAGVDKELYSCEYLQFVDTFVYFSHKLVCVPPPTWTNTLHRNGVEALGTFLIEPQTEGSERLLNHTTEESGDLNFPMAKKLASIATHFGFDGWLINIEKPFPSDVWDPEVLEAFLRQLKAELGVDRRLIWYDALTTPNKISYQNALTSSNLKFADACENLLTNYCWTDIHVSESIKLGQYAGYLGPYAKGKKKSIYFGVDVWAQKKSSFTHPRVTYPEYGGGGTNTGVALARLSDTGLSAMSGTSNAPSGKVLHYRRALSAPAEIAHRAIRQTKSVQSYTQPKSAWQAQNTSFTPTSPAHSLHMMTTQNTYSTTATQTHNWARNPFFHVQPAFSPKANASHSRTK
ncbi:hypothetical protein J4E90_007872 [Alternaria incomplexa]|uniref:uncharacterized protein n=1 Tax=Alternaria incomplexa TaxID=1187928 RepID=UPI002220F199|nr:uncharacterized protein J4E90_007872 [Alternaria incomplexa]KAI4910436.1 hypothetical protein J4E90_007872 [Alternaria incomplexa]